MNYLAQVRTEKKTIPPNFISFSSWFEYVKHAKYHIFHSSLAKWSTRKLWQYILTYVMPAFPTTQYSNKDTIIIADENQFCPIFICFSNDDKYSEDGQ